MDYHVSLDFEDREGGIPMGCEIFTVPGPTVDPTPFAFEWLSRTRPEMARRKWLFLRLPPAYDFARRAQMERPEGHSAWGTPVSGVGDDWERYVLDIAPCADLFLEHCSGCRRR